MKFTSTTQWSGGIFLHRGIYRNKVGTSGLSSQKLSLVVSQLRTLIIKSFVYLLYSYFVAVSELSCLAKLAKPYLVYCRTLLPQILHQLYYKQRSAHQLLS